MKQQIAVHRTGVSGYYWIGNTGMLFARRSYPTRWQILSELPESSEWYEEYLYEETATSFPTLREACEFLQALFTLCPPPEVEVLAESQLDASAGVIHGNDRDYRLLNNGGSGLNRWVVFCDEEVIAVSPSLWDVRRQVARHERSASLRGSM